MKTCKVVVKIQLDDDMDPLDFVANCDYEFSGDGLISSEIVSVLDEGDSLLY